MKKLLFFGLVLLASGVAGLSVALGSVKAAFFWLFMSFLVAFILCLFVCAFRQPKEEDRKETKIELEEEVLG